MHQKPLAKSDHDREGLEPRITDFAKTSAFTLTEECNNPQTYDQLPFGIYALGMNSTGTRQ
jgi:hypothetical protein